MGKNNRTKNINAEKKIKTKVVLLEIKIPVDIPVASLGFYFPSFPSFCFRGYRNYTDKRRRENKRPKIRETKKSKGKIAKRRYKNRSVRKIEIEMKIKPRSFSHLRSWILLFLLFPPSLSPASGQYLRPIFLS